MEAKDKAIYCRNLGYLVEEKKGWHIQVSWEARDRLPFQEFMDFMKRLGWEKNVYGMLRHHQREQ